MKNEYFSSENSLEENLKRINKRLMIYGISTLIFGILFSCFTVFFINNFQINPNTFGSINSFLMVILFFIIFVFLLEKVLALKEESILIKDLGGINESPYKRDEYNKKKENIKREKTKNSVVKFFSRVFRILEEFPYLKNKKGKKKLILQVVGWIGIVLLFSIAIIVRIAVIEFGSCGCLINEIRQWAHYFASFVFILTMGAFIIYLTAKTNPHHIFKLAIFGVMILIQVPALVDYYFMPSAIPYNYIYWEDFLKAFSSFLLHPDLDYACGIGHFVMLILIILFFSLYVMVRRIEFASQYKSKVKIFFISSRTVLSAFLIYSFVMLFGFAPQLILKMLDLSMVSYPNGLAYSLVSDFFIFPLFIYLAFEIFYDEKMKNAEIIRLKDIKFPRQDKNEELYKIIQKKYELKSNTRLKMGILIIAFLIYFVIRIQINWINPHFSFSW